MKIDLNEVRQFGSLELLARQMVEGFITGLHKSPYHGFSVEFAEHKVYNPGESTRYVDWKVFAKTDRLYTKRYEEETNLRAQILLDTSASMYYPAPSHAKLTFSIGAAAALTYLLQRQRDAVGLTTFANQVLEQTPVKSTPSHLRKLFLTLEGLRTDTPPPARTAVADVLHRVAGQLHRRSLVMIFSDMFDDTEAAEDVFAALRHLKYRQHEVLLFHVVDHATEFDFDFEERPHEFVDLETGERVKVQPGQVREHYRKAMGAYRTELKNRCGQYKIDYVEVDVHDNVRHVLLPYLVKRRRMG